MNLHIYFRTQPGFVCCLIDGLYTKHMGHFYKQSSHYSIGWYVSPYPLRRIHVGIDYLLLSIILNGHACIFISCYTS